MEIFQIFIALLLCSVCSAISQEEPNSVAESSEENGLTETTTAIASEDNNIERHNTFMESRRKKDGMHQMYMMFMMCKSVISTIMMLVQPIFQFKGMVISVIGLLINIARFITMLKQSKTGGGGSGGWSGYGALISSGAPWGEDRIGSPLPPAHFRPNYITKYSIRE